MHCPKCGQQQVSDEIRYCSRCGLLLTGISAVVANNGELPASSAASGKKDSPRKRGVKQGAIIFLLAFLFVPLLALFHLLTGTEPFLAVGAMILFAGGTILRVAWALLFESGEPGDPFEISTAAKKRRFSAGSARHPNFRVLIRFPRRFTLHRKPARGGIRMNCQRPAALPTVRPGSFQRKRTINSQQPPRHFANQ